MVRKRKKRIINNFMNEKSQEKISESELIRKEVSDAIHGDNPREGPGNSESTRKAFSMLVSLPSQPSILDVGCGPGMQTIELAKLSGGNITALDYQQRFLDELNTRAKGAGVANQIRTAQGSMFELPFAADSFDVIWSEGAIYIIGLEKGLSEWKPLLKDGGYLAASHLSWLKPEIPDEPKQFWAKHYPAIAHVDENLKIATEAGYNNVGHFVLPESAWWDGYYTPIEAKLEKLRERYKGNDVALDRISKTQEEIDLRKNYSDYYGYVFYVLQKGK